jgi:hypothetical protein
MARLLAICGSGRFWERSLTQLILSDASPSIGSTSGLRPLLATLLETRGFRSLSMVNMNLRASIAFMGVAHETEMLVSDFGR